MMEKFSFDLPVKLRFGCGTVDELQKQTLPGKRVLLVTGGNSIKKNGTLAHVREMAEPKCEAFFLFDDVKGNPTLDCVEQGTAFAKENHVDCVIGLGGGSAMDAAKSIAIMAVNEGSLWDYASVGSGKGRAFTQKCLPLILIPTTAGTGSEGNKTAVITNSKTGEKFGLRTDFASMGFVDPELTLSVPERFTAIQGYDALCHCMEAFLSVKANPISDAWALEGTRQVLEWLPKAVANGRDIEARYHVSYGAMLGGIVIYLASCTSAHVLEHAISALNPAVDHGMGLAIVSDAFHGKVAHYAPERYAELAAALGLTEEGMGVREQAQAFLDRLRRFRSEIHLGEVSLKDYGFVGSDVPGLIERTLVHAGGKLNRDRYCLSDEDLEDVFRSVMEPGV